MSDTAGRSMFLRLAGLAVGTSCVVLATSADFFTISALALAAALFAWAERLEPDTATHLTSERPAEWPRPALLAVAAAILLCLISAWAVLNDMSLRAQHAPWALALSTFAATSLLAPPAAPAMPRARFDLAAMCTLLVACALIFGWGFPSVPVEVHGDETEVGLDALRLLEESNRGFFTSGWFGLPIVHAAPTALSFLLFGPDLFGLRFSSTVLGTFSVLLLYGLVRRLADSRLAFAAALILAGQRYFIHISRSGYDYIDIPLLSLLALYLLVRRRQDGRLAPAVGCGVVLGLSMYTDFAARIVPIMLTLTAVLIGWRDRMERVHVGRDLILITGVAAAVAAPLLAHYAGDWSAFWARAHASSLFDADVHRHLTQIYRSDSIAEQFAIQVRKAVAVFHVGGDNSGQYGYRAPMVDPLSGVLIIAGIGTALARPWLPLHAIILLWIGLPLIAGALTEGTPFYPRLSGIMPPAALAIAIGGLRVAHGVASALSLSPRGHRGLTAALLGAVLALNLSTYFGHYTSTYRHTPIPEIAAWVRAQGRGFKTYLFDASGEFSVSRGTIAFLSGGLAGEDVRDFDDFFTNRKIDRDRARFAVVAGNERALEMAKSTFGPLDVEAKRNPHGDITVYLARPAGARDAPLAPRRAAAQSQRAKPWLVWLALTAGIGTIAALRWRRAAPPAAATAVAPPMPPAAATADPQQAIAGWASALALLAIVALAAWLRLADLGELPAGFYCDEAGNAYNAASILNSGRDENGARWPLYVWSFDTSYKNPVFIYAATIPTALFGATPFAARFTAASFGIAAVLAIFFLGRAIGGAITGLCAALLLAVAPWHLHFSRIAFELIALPTFFIAGTTALVLFVQGKRTLAWAAVAFAVCLYTYVPAKLLVPLFLFGFAAIFGERLWQRRREAAVAGLLFAVLAAPLVHFDLTNRNRASSYFRDTTFLADDMSVGEKVEKLARNYTHFYSPSFFFQNGDRILRHAVRNHGELYPIMAPLMLLGAVAIARSRSPGWVLVLLWLIIYPLAAIFIRREIPSATRAIVGVPAFCLLAAAGMDWVIRWARNLSSPRISGRTSQLLTVTTLGILLAAQVIHYWRLYTEDYPAYTSRHYVGFQHGHEPAMRYFADHAGDYDRFILTTTRSNQPEIFLRYFIGLQQPARSVAPPFEAPENMERGHPEELFRYGRNRTLYAATPRDLLYFADYDILETIRAPDGGVSFFLVDVRQSKDFAHVWMITGPFAEKETPPLPAFDPAAPPHQEQGRAWRRYQLRKAAIYFRHHFGDEPADSCAWAVNFVHLRREVQARVLAGFDDRGEVWINGEPIEMTDQDNAFFTWIDTSFGDVTLREGRNSIAVKSCNISGGWRMFFRLADREGNNLPALDWEYTYQEGL